MRIRCGIRRILTERYAQVAEAYIELAAMPPPPSSDKGAAASTMPLPGKVSPVCEGCERCVESVLEGVGGVGSR